jgi:hypothetical protein
LHIISDANNWLGRSQWNDAMYQGKFNEFRIWEGALSADQVTVAFAAGPDQVPVVTPAPTLTVSLSASSIVIGWPATATGFGMESIGVLGTAAGWNPVDISGAVDVGGQMRLTLPITEATQYYRMKK